MRAARRPAPNSGAGDSGVVCRRVSTGVDGADYVTVGCLLGQKTFLNEFVAFQNVDYIQKGFSEEFEPMTERSLKIATYALCGFSNIGSVGMTISGQRP